MRDPDSSLATTNLLIGLDDADNEESKGTAFLAQRLLASMDERRVGAALGATRHQLFVDPGIPSTSDNRSICLALRASHRLEVSAIAEFVAEFLEAERVAGSNPGVAIARESAWDDPDAESRLVAYGHRAKSEVLEEASATALAPEVNVDLSVHGGNGRGVIGALAAVALHVSGDDGVFVWMPDIRDLAGQLTYRQLRLLAPAIDVALDASGREPAPEDFIDLGDRVRPVLLGGRAVLLLEPPMTTTAQSGGFGARPKPVTSWSISPRDVVNQH